MAAQLADVIMANLLEVIPTEPDIDVQIALMESLQEVVETGAVPGGRSADFVPVCQHRASPPACSYLDCAFNS